METVTSAGTPAIANINDPTVGTPAILGTTSQGNILSVDTTSLSDDDGLGPLSYQWLRNGIAIGGATSDSYLLDLADVGATISVSVDYLDGNGTSESTTSGSTTPITAVNSPVTGAPNITGAVTEDETLTADTSGIGDADGLGPFSYQWKRDGINIAGATATTYTLGDDDVGKSITVLVSYLDGLGTMETVSSASTGAVANVNDLTTGSVVVTGTPVEDETLTADASSLADDDGLGTLSYQWQRDGVDISGATGTSYTLIDTDVGAIITAQVSHTDDNGTLEIVTSTGTPGIGNINDLPAGTVTIVGSPAEDQTLTADTSTLGDDDGLGALSFQWQRDGIAIAGATADTYTLGDADVGSVMTVHVSYVDGNGTAENITSGATSAVSNVNDPATGTAVITGTPTEDQTLSADASSIADIEGLGPFSYQWQRDGVAIAGATGTTYTLGDADVGAAMTVEVSYTDGLGTLERVTSAGTTPVANINDPLVGAPFISGTAAEDQTLTADSSAVSDDDGLGTLSWQWYRDGNPIDGATDSTYTLGDEDIDSRFTATLTYTDGNGTVESAASAPTDVVANVNDPVTGTIAITGRTLVDETLSADASSLGDEDGLGDFSWQWLRDGVPVAGATTDTYTLSAQDAGASMSVQVSYLDGRGTEEMASSAATDPIDLESAPDDGFSVPLDPSQLGGLLGSSPGAGSGGADSSPATPDSGSDEQAAEEEQPGESAPGADTAEAEGGRSAADGLNVDQSIFDQSRNTIFAPGFSSSGTADNSGLSMLDVSFAADQSFEFTTEDRQERTLNTATAVTIEARELSFERLHQLSGPLDNVDTWLESGGFLDGIDRLREDAIQDAELDKLVVGSSFALSGGLSVGYLLWAARSGVLLSSVLSTLPVWRFIDPFPVLSSNTLLLGDDDDDETLASIASNTDAADSMEEDDD